jgi:hypothetical protein
MATRNTISRITSRIDELTERHTPSRAPILIAVSDEAEYRVKREIEAAGGLSGRRVIFIRTGVPRRSAEFGQWSAAKDVADG